MLNNVNEEELDFYLQLESEWRKNQTDPTFYELIEDFPNAKPAAKRGILARIKQLKAEIKHLNNRHSDLVKAYCAKVGTYEYREMKMILDKDLEEEIEKRQQEIKKLVYQKRFLNPNNTDPTLIPVSREMIEKAKAVPITQFIKTNRDSKAICPFHSERTPSMHVYKKKNNFYCFSCAKGGDVIALVQKLEGLSFVEAVKKLNL